MHTIESYRYYFIKIQFEMKKLSSNDWVIDSQFSGEGYCTLFFHATHNKLHIKLDESQDSIQKQARCVEEIQKWISMKKLIFLLVTKAA